MKVFVVDISGKVPYYDHFLSAALDQENPYNIILATPFKQGIYLPKYKVKRLLRFVHRKSRIGKFWKSIECLLNYIFLLFDILFHKYDVIHFQWLPFLEYIAIEKFFLDIYRTLSPKSKFVLTQHNLYPHNSSHKAKLLYNKRMQAVKNKFDHFIVHTESSKAAFCEEFKVEVSKVTVIYHGVFMPDIMPVRKSTLNLKRILMFGIQSFYKGTDILVDAVDLLAEDDKTKIHVTIAGGTEERLLAEKLPLAEKNRIIWVPRYVEDDELSQLIADSDILVLPYRSISQSGVLLQSLPYKKHLLVSDLPSFRETLKGYPGECFFTAGSAESLAKSISDYINGNIDLQKEMIANQNLIELYSWSKSAKKTVELYRKLRNV